MKLNNNKNKILVGIGLFIVFIIIIGIVIYFMNKNNDDDYDDYYDYNFDEPGNTGNGNTGNGNTGNGNTGNGNTENVGYDFYQDKKIEGDTYKEYDNISSYQDCQNLCSESNSCVAYAYKKNGNSNIGLCRLRSSFSQIKDDANYDSGKKRL